MTYATNNNHVKLDKYFGSCSSKQQELINLLKEYYAVNLFYLNHDRRINNELVYQIENDYSPIAIKYPCLKDNPRILYLLKILSKEEREKAFRVSIELVFKCNLSNRKMIFENDRLVDDNI